MTADRFVALGGPSFNETRDAVHAYAQVLGNLLKRCREKRKHWWHASLRPSLHGLTTGVVYAPVDFELKLNLRDSTLFATTVTGARLILPLHGQAAGEVGTAAREFLAGNGVPEPFLPATVTDDASAKEHTGYAPQQAASMAQGLAAIAAAMTVFRAGIREECSPIQLWSHHFDLSMLWLTGAKISGQDPDDEEVSDQQMNFGFTFGDGAIPEPYCYVTAYPLPGNLPATPLPAGATWHTEGFSGALLPYRRLREAADPHASLLELWSTLLAAGRAGLRDGTGEVTRHD